MRKILQKLLSKLFIVSTIIIIQMIWWFFLFYTASVASRVFQDLLYVAAILLSLYIVNRRMKMYIKMSWIFFDTECSNRWDSVLFLFWKTGAYVEDTEKNGKNCGSICAASA